MKSLQILLETRSDATQNGSVDVLAQGDTATFTSTYIVTQADIDAGIDVNNTAIADGTPANGTLLPVEDNETVSPVTAAPSFTVEKATSSTPSNAGDTLTYTFDVNNTGNVSLTPVTVTDAKCAAVPTLISESLTADTILEVGELQVYSCTSIPVTQTEIDAGAVFNSVSVTGTPPSGPPPPPVEDNLTTPVTAAPSFTVEKATSSTPSNAGDTLTYTFDVNNTGNVSLTPVTVTDAKCAAVPTLISESLTADTILEVGELQVYSCTSIPVTQTEIDAGAVFNSVSVTGTPPSGPPPPPVEDNLTTPVTAAPSFTVEKATSSTPSNAGDTLTYTFDVNNTGNVSLTPVTVTDAKCAAVPTLISESLTADTILEVGELQVYSCTSIPVTQTEIDAGAVFNSVSVTGTPPSGPPPPPVEDNLTTPVTAAPSFTVEKATSSTPSNAGDTLTYTFDVNNTGNVSLTPVTVTDAKCAAVPTLISESLTADTILEVGELQVYSCTSIPVTQTEIDAGAVFNSVSVTGTPPSGPPPPPVEDNLTTPVTAAPSFTVEKATSSTPSNAGDTLTYTFDVNNTGNVSLTPVTVTDAKCAAVPTLISESLTADTILEVGELQVYSCTSIPVTQTEIDAGAVFNSVSVTGTPPSGPPPPPVEDNLTTPVTAAPSFTVEKATSSTPSNAGDTLTYTFDVNNTGNVSLTPVTVTDAKCAAVPTLISESLTADTILEVGELQVYSCTSIPVTQTEIDAGAVFNSVSVTGTPPSGPPPPPVEDNLTTPVTAAPAIDVNKSNPVNTDEDGNGDVTLGDTLTYTITLTNIGNITLNDVNVSDVLITPSSVVCSSVAPGDTCILTGTHIVTQQDVDAGVINNTAIGNSNETPPKDDNVSTPVIPYGVAAGTVYEDTDGSGVQDPGEPGIANVTVTVVDLNGSVYILTTDSNGNYATKVPAGDVTVTLDTNTLPTSVNTQTEGTNPTTITVPSGGIGSDVDGYSPSATSGTVTGVVYEDTDGSWFTRSHVSKAFQV